MRIPESGTCFIIFLCLLTRKALSYDVSLSKDYIKTEVNKWSNFSMHIENKGYIYTDTVTMVLNHTNDVKVSPEIVEIYSKNFSSWCHMFHVYSLHPGISRITFNFVNSSLRDDATNLQLNVDVVKIKALEPYAEWFRKFYYIFSTISKYPQVFLLFLRLSVVGLDMDYVCFNFIGHLSYCIYTFIMYIQQDAFVEKNLYEEFPVTLSENMYALHGLIFSILLGIQAIKYYGVDKRVSVIGKELITFYGIVFVFGFLLAKFNIIQYLDFLYICKYIHIAASSTKYIPQIYRNYIIKTTFGWNIWTSNLEIIACLSIISNLFIISFNYDNWKQVISEDLFWMACAISLQHIVFLIQHYFIYKKWTEFDLSEFQEITLEEKISLYEKRLDHC